MRVRTIYAFLLQYALHWSHIRFPSNMLTFIVWFLLMVLVFWPKFPYFIVYHMECIFGIMCLVLGELIMDGCTPRVSNYSHQYCHVLCYNSSSLILVIVYVVIRNSCKIVFVLEMLVIEMCSSRELTINKPNGLQQLWYVWLDGFFGLPFSVITIRRLLLEHCLQGPKLFLYDFISRKFYHFVPWTKEVLAGNLVGLE